MEQVGVAKPSRPELQGTEYDGENLQNGLAKLVLVIVDILRDLLERQAMRRVKLGTLGLAEVEQLGLAFIHIRQKIKQISEEFGIDHKELTLGLGSLGQLSGARPSQEVTLTDVLDRLIDEGTVVAGEILISVAGIDLVVLNLLLSLCSVACLERNSGKRWRKD